MNKPLDELYFTWLYSQVGDLRTKNQSLSYWRLLRLLYIKEFVWIVPNDDNRVADGRDLRYEFVDQSGLDDVDPGWINLGCSMFELLVGLSRRLSFEADGRVHQWFWRLLNNIGLAGCNDKAEWDDKEVDAILDQVIWRTYKPDGRGGLFPLNKPTQDQTQVELWYQLNAYILEL